VREGKGREGEGEEKEETGKEGKGEGEGARKGRGKVASWLLGDGRLWALWSTVCGPSCEKNNTVSRPERGRAGVAVM